MKKLKHFTKLIYMFIMYSLLHYNVTFAVPDTVVSNIGERTFLFFNEQWHLENGDLDAIPIETSAHIIQFTATSSQQDRDQFISSNGFVISYESIYQDHVFILDISGEDFEDAMNAVNNSSIIEMDNVNIIFTRDDDPEPFVPDDPGLTNQYYLDLIEAGKAWQYMMDENFGPLDEIIVAVIDDGLDWLHPDIGPGDDNYDNLWRNSGDIWDDINDPNSGNNIDDDGNGYIDDWLGVSLFATSPGYSNNISSTNGHGTKVSGIITAKANNDLGIAGIAGGFSDESPGARLMTIKYSLFFSNAALYRSIDYAILMGAHIINLSFHINFQGGKPIDELSKITKSIEKAYLEHNILIVSSSANEEDPEKLLTPYPCKIRYVMCVSNTDANDGIVNRAVSEVSAPGEGIYTTNNTDLGNGYTTVSGTSFSAPQVCAVAALLLSGNPFLENNEIRGAIRNSSEKAEDMEIYGFSGSSVGHGCGRLNAFRSLKYMTEHCPKEAIENRIDIGNEVIIIGTETWETPKILRNIYDLNQEPHLRNYTKGRIVIKQGATLTIKTWVFMPMNGEIIVERGGKLILEGARLTSGCNSWMWNGIQVWGTNGVVITDANAHGKIEVLDGSVIEHARIAVALYKPNNDLEYDFSSSEYSGGQINAHNSTFRNNYRAVDFRYFSFTIPNSNVRGMSTSHIVTCIFETTEYLKDYRYNNADANTYKNVSPYGSSFEDFELYPGGYVHYFDGKGYDQGKGKMFASPEFIRIEGMYGVSVKSNTFINRVPELFYPAPDPLNPNDPVSNNLREYNAKGTGINIIDSRTNIIAWPYIGLSSIASWASFTDPPIGYYNTFENLSFGIRQTNIFTATKTDIFHCLFKNVVTGIYSQHSHFLNIRKNIFHFDEEFDLREPMGIGLYMKGSVINMIDELKFEADNSLYLSSNYNGKIYGSVINNTLPLGSTYYRNNHINLTESSQFEFNNENVLVECNDYHDYQQAIRVLGEFGIPPKFSNQGFCVPDLEWKSAGNHFFRNNTESNIDINSETPFNYYHSNVNNEEIDYSNITASYMCGEAVIPPHDCPKIYNNPRISNLLVWIEEDPDGERIIISEEITNAGTPEAEAYYERKYFLTLGEVVRLALDSHFYDVDFIYEGAYMDSLIDILDYESSFWVKSHLTTLYINTNDLQSAQEILTSLDNSNDVEIENFVELYQLIVDLRSVGKTIYELEPHEEIMVRQIAESETFSSGAARSILAAAYNEYTIFRPLKEQSGSSKRLLSAEDVVLPLPEKDEFIIYPNPSQANFYIIPPENFNDSVMEIKIYDNNGRVIKSIEIIKAEPKEFSLANQADGIYLYHIISNGQEVSNGKIIKR